MHIIEPFVQFGLPWRKIRVALETGSDIRPIFWIDCLNGTDLHWGSLHPIRSAARLHPTDGWVDVELIEDRDIPERRDFHISYHTKGHYHVKRGWVDGQCYCVPPFREIVEPIRVGGLLTAHGDTYSVSARSLDRGKAHPLRVLTPPELLDRRHYFDITIAQIQDTIVLPDRLC